MKKNNILNTKHILISEEKEKKAFLDLEEEILHQVAKALKGHRSMEAYFLAWSTIEQFMLPRLIHFVARNLKIVVPKDSLETNYIHLIKYYYFLSHDHELFLALDKGRKNRNDLTHKLYKKESWDIIKKDFKKCLKKDIANIFQLFQDRLKGKTPIPVLTLYTSGWNDSMKKTIEIIKSKR